MGKKVWNRLSLHNFGTKTCFETVELALEGNSGLNPAPAVTVQGGKEVVASSPFYRKRIRRGPGVCPEWWGQVSSGCRASLQKQFKFHCSSLPFLSLCQRLPAVLPKGLPRAQSASLCVGSKRRQSQREGGGELKIGNKCRSCSTGQAAEQRARVDLGVQWPSLRHRSLR